MGYGFAGAAAGMGQALLDWAKEKREHANRLLEMDHRESLARGRMEYAAEMKGKGGSGGGSGGAVGRALSARERDDIGRYFKSAFDEDDLSGDPKPTLAEFESYIERTRKKGESLGQSAERAAREWSVRDETTSVERERSALSPARLWGGATYTEERTNRVGGFGAALGEQAATAAPPAAPPAAAAAPASGGGAPASGQTLEEARQAIAKGANPDAVADRLRQMGIDPSEL